MPELRLIEGGGDPSAVPPEPPFPTTREELRARGLWLEARLRTDMGLEPLAIADDAA